MVNDELYAEDISELWGARDDDDLEPMRAVPALLDVTEASPESNGSQAATDVRKAGVTELAEAIAGHQVGTASKEELQTVRSQLEGAFTQQLAVALYELLAATDQRFASVEGRLDQRLQGMASRITEAVGEQVDRMRASVELQQRSSAETTEGVVHQLDALREQLVRPHEMLTAFQRDMRHEVGRLRDGLAAARVEFDNGHAPAGDVSGQLADVSERVTALQTELAALHQGVADLRQAVEGQGRRGRGRGRRRRIGEPHAPME